MLLSEESGTRAGFATPPRQLEPRSQVQPQPAGHGVSRAHRKSDAIVLHRALVFGLQGGQDQLAARLKKLLHRSMSADPP